MTKNPKSITEMVDMWCAEVGRPPMANYVFDKQGDFQALNEAIKFARSLGFSCGPLDGSNPIGLAPEEERIGKWHTILCEHRCNLKGLIVSHGFREGPCVMVTFK